MHTHTRLLIYTHPLPLALFQILLLLMAVGLGVFWTSSGWRRFDTFSPTPTNTTHTGPKGTPPLTHITNYILTGYISRWGISEEAQPFCTVLTTHTYTIGPILPVILETPPTYQRTSHPPLTPCFQPSYTSDTASPASITALNAHRPTQYDTSIILSTSSLRPPGLR